MTEKNLDFAISAVTEYELYIGNSPEQNIFWDNFFSQIIVMPFDTKVAKRSVAIYKQLKNKNQLIDIPDIMIAGTAIQNNLPIATLNRKHFERIKELEIITDNDFK